MQKINKDLYICFKVNQSSSVFNFNAELAVVMEQPSANILTSLLKSNR